MHKILGKPLVLWVAERISSQAPQYPLYFAVDHPLIAEILAPKGFRVVMTDPRHRSGTDRLAEANRTIGAASVINVQADEPLVSLQHIARLSELIQGDAVMATLAMPFAKAADYRNPNQVKVVCDASGRALYFSRSPIPYGRDLEGGVDDAWVGSHPCYRHLGLYAYRADFLEGFARLPVGRLEQIEKLEQLRALENGYDIRVGLTDQPSIGVDTPEDAEEFERSLQGSGCGA